MNKKIYIIVTITLIITGIIFLNFNKPEVTSRIKYPFQGYDRGINDILDIDFGENIKILDKHHRITFHKLPSQSNSSYIHNRSPIGSVELKKELGATKYEEYLKDGTILIVSPFNAPPYYIINEKQIEFYGNKQEIYSTGSIILYNKHIQVESKGKKDSILKFYPINQDVWGGYSQTIDILDPNIILYDRALLVNDFKVTINKQEYIPKIKYEKVYNHSSNITKYSYIPYYELTITLPSGIFDIFYKYIKYELNNDIITIEGK